MVRFAACASLAALTACIPGMDPNIGTVTMQNTDDQQYELLISQEESCIMGTRTRILPNTQTTFDIDKTTGGWICIGESPPPIPVKDGMNYLLRNGRLSEKQ